jgi:hypothetical protein
MQFVQHGVDLLNHAVGIAILRHEAQLEIGGNAETIGLAVHHRYQALDVDWRIIVKLEGDPPITHGGL